MFGCFTSCPYRPNGYKKGAPTKCTVAYFSVSYYISDHEYWISKSLAPLHTPGVRK